MFTAIEQDLINYYLEMTDAILYQRNYLYIIETPETTLTFNSKAELMAEIENNINEIRKAVS